MNSTALLGTVGLVCELVGGFLLSIELLWDVNRLVANVERFLAWIVANRLWGLVAAAGSGSSILNILWYYDLFLPPFATDWLEVFPAVISSTLVGAPLFIAVFVIVEGIGRALGAFLTWVASGDRTRRVAQFGFIVLLVGFTFQASVNFLQS
jgi:hypothetical protein